MARIAWSLHEVLKALTSGTAISVFKGALAYVLIFVLVFIKGFESLSPYPITFTSAIIVAIAGFPGKSVGACVQGVTLGLLGVGVGAFNFYVLAKLGHHLVGQAFVFFGMVYILALIKAQGIQFFAFSLLAILMSFNGIYTSLLLRGEFSSVYLLAYFKSYLWGGAIALFVNIFVFPHSAEKELRATLVMSLDHIRTFAHLIGKTYRTDISEEEEKIRDDLNQNIRADFGVLQMKLAETYLEINWSRWSMADYAKLVGLTRQMQQSLITTYSSLMDVESSELRLFHHDFLHSAKDDFHRLHKAIYVCLTDIQSELNVGSFDRSSHDAEYFKKMQPNPNEPADQSPRVGDVEKGQGTSNWKTMQSKLDNELDVTQSQTPAVSRRPSYDADNDITKPDLKSRESNQSECQDPTSASQSQKEAAQNINPGGTSCTTRLWERWSRFRASQLNHIGDILASGSLHGGGDQLLVDLPMSSMKATWGSDREGPRQVPIQRSSQTLEAQKTISGTKTNDRSSTSGSIDSPNDSTRADPLENPDYVRKVTDTNHSLLRVYSFSYAMDVFIKAMIDMHKHTASGDKKTRKRLHFHIFEGLNVGKRRKRDEIESSGADGMSVPEALCILEGREYVTHKVTIFHRIQRFERFFRSAESITAFKTACAVIVFAVLFWAQDVRQFAIDYSITGGLLTTVVALSPTLGQSFVSFVFQISGQGIGYLYAFIILEIFNNVGGYKYNPYGIAFMLVPYALVMCYVLYTKPQFFVLALLAMNSCGVLIFTEWIYRHRPNFDSPAYRMGKGFATLAIALALVSAFQLLILRNPARRTLRKAVAHLMRETTAYTLILQAYVRATVPSDGNGQRASDVAIRRVASELQKRELQLQAEMIGLSPLLMFAKAEPSPNKFDMATWLRIIKANQIILDRNRDARLAIGTEPLDDLVIDNFVHNLAPYRRKATRFTRAGMYACTCSLMTKLPMPRELPDPREIAPMVFHDALTVSSRLAKTERGNRLVRSHEFTRYWLYILSAISGSTQLVELEAAIKVLFGELESDTSPFSPFKEN